MKILMMAKKNSALIVASIFFLYFLYFFILEKTHPYLPRDQLIKSYVDVISVNYQSPHFIFRTDDGRVVKANVLGSLLNYKPKLILLKDELIGKNFKRCHGWIEYEEINYIASINRVYAMNCGEINIDYDKSVRYGSDSAEKFVSYALLIWSFVSVFIAYMIDRRNVGGDHGDK